MIMRRKVDSWRADGTRSTSDDERHNNYVQPRMKEWMWPTPRASTAMSEDSGQYQGERSGQGETWTERVAKMMTRLLRQEIAKDSWGKHKITKAARTKEQTSEGRLVAV
jgi:hypothetical protein